MKNLYDFIFEKLILSRDVQVTKKPSVRAPWINVMRTDTEKMNEYRRKGSKPSRLVSTIKDSEKLKRRFAVACNMKWNEAVNEFGKALVSRKIFTQEQVDAYIDTHTK